MKIKSIIFFLFLCFNTLHSSEIACDCWVAELRGGYFYPTSKKVREIYPCGGPEGEIEVLKIFRNNWIGWGNINYFQKDGHSLGFRDKTTLRIVPISFGLKYQFLRCQTISPYIGVGAACTIVNVKNNSDSVKKHVTKASWGFVIKSGTYVDLSECFLLDVFVDYYSQEMHFYSRKANVGGVRAGVGLGYRY